ncbi:MAG: hypothetical protein DMG14_21870 [Acidobacteria bacterium]|nr:MAG: hypothetical protein DMG14_21870 [Acidobacteriota bacterium]
MPKAWKVLVGIGFLALIGFIIYSATGLARVSCEVCVEFHGRTSCQPAAGTTQDEAVKTAEGIACSELASGRTENIACERTPPKSVACK